MTHEISTAIHESLSLKQASQKTGIPERTLRGWIHNGSLPAYRVNNFLIRIRVEDLNRLFVPVSGGEQ